MQQQIVLQHAHVLRRMRVLMRWYVLNRSVLRASQDSMRIHRRWQLPPQLPIGFALFAASNRDYSCHVQIGDARRHFVCNLRRCQVSQTRPIFDQLSGPELVVGFRTIVNTRVLDCTCESESHAVSCSCRYCSHLPRAANICPYRPVMFHNCQERQTAYQAD